MKRAPACCALVAVLWACAVAASGADAPSSKAAAPALRSARPTFYVSASGATAMEPAIAIGVANEFYKQLYCEEQTDAARRQPCLAKRAAARAAGAVNPWVMPVEGWSPSDITQRCFDRPGTLGGVTIDYYYDNGTHFLLLWQAEATYLHLSAVVVLCNPPARAGTVPAAVTTPNPEIVDAVLELPGADGNSSHPSQWIVHHSQISVPLLTIGAVGGLAAKVYNPTSTAKTADTVSTSVIVGSIFNQASTRDVPGFSIPVRMRTESQHVGVNLLRAIGYDCRPPAGDLQPICDAFHL